MLDWKKSVSGNRAKHVEYESCGFDHVKGASSALISLIVKHGVEMTDAKELDYHINC